MFLREKAFEIVAMAIFAFTIFIFFLSCKQPESDTGTGTTGAVNKRINVTYAGLKTDWKTKDWGFPPTEDAIIDIPELPEIKGWYRYIGTSDTPDSVIVGFGVTVLFISGEAIAYESDSGKEMWRYKVGDDYAMIASSWVEPDYVIVGCNNNAYVIGKKSGELVFSRRNAFPCAFGNGKLWVLGVTDPDKYYMQTYKDVFVLNVENGSEACKFETGDIYGYGFEHELHVDEMALRTVDQIWYVKSDGTSKKWNVKNKSWSGGLTVTTDGICTTEYYDIFQDRSFDSSNWSEEDYNRKMKDNGCENGVSPLDVTYYDKSGNEIWNKRLESEYYSMGSSWMDSKDGIIIVSSNPGFLILDEKTGDVRFNPSESDAYGGISYFMFENDLIYYSGCDYTNNKQYLKVMDPKSLKEIYSDSTDGMNLWRFFVRENDLAYTASTSQDDVQGGGCNNHLFTFKLGKDGLPVKGRMSMFDVPKDMTPIRDKFYKSKDPLSDDKQMKEIVKNGVSCFNILLSNLEKADDAHIDTLAIIALYMDKAHGSNSGYSCSAIQILARRLNALKNEKFTPAVIRWLDNEKDEFFHNQMLGVLAACGGAEAKTYLDKYYYGFTVATHNAPVPPYQMKAPEYAPGRHEGRGEAPTDVWSETTTGDGTRYAAFIASGLLSARDIYLGIDKDNDGEFDEILPTGLTDTYFYNIHPGGMGGLQERKGPIELSVSGDKIDIKHHKPIITTETGQG